MCVLSARYMRSRLLMGPTGPEGKVPPGDPYVPRDVPGQRRVCDTAEGAPMEPRYPFHGRG